MQLKLTFRIGPKPLNFLAVSSRFMDGWMCL
jgi:hypothetical protein